MDPIPTEFQVKLGGSGCRLSGSKPLSNLGLKHNSNENKEIQNSDLKNKEIKTQTHEKSTKEQRNQNQPRRPNP